MPPHDDATPVEQPTPLSPTTARLAETAFKALGHPVRLRIVVMLSQTPRQSVYDLLEHVPVKQPTLSHHLKLLRQAGLVQADRKGTWAYYQLRPEALIFLQGVLSDLMPTPTPDA